MATLLSICQNIARGTSSAVPSVIVGSTGTHEASLYQAVEDARKSLYRAHDWVDLQREHTFNTAASTADYALPDDFGRQIDGTAWDRANYWQMRGNLSPQEWQTYKSSVLGSSLSIFRRYRFKAATHGAARRYFIDPTPSAVEALVFEYVSKYLVVDSGGTAKEAFTADTDLPIIYPDLLELHAKWRFMKALGVEYGVSEEEANDATEQFWGQENPGQTLTLSPRRGPLLGGPQNVPDTGYGA